MRSPEEFESKYSKDELAEELPDSPVTSLRDLQYLYGKLYTLATVDGGEYAPYLTPDAASDLVDTDDSLIVVRVDLSGDEPELADDERRPVWVTRYTQDRVQNVAHCYYQNRGAGIDHSISHKSGRNKSPEKLGEYATHRFTRWPSEDAVKHVAENHADGEILSQLEDVGSDEELLEQVENEVKRQIGDSQTALLTVQLKLDEDSPYLWPGEVDVLMDAMRAQRISKLVSKNKASDSSGEATDLVTEERTRAVGTAQDPLNYFLGKQVEKFPGLDIEEAWRAHPVSEETALTVMKADEFVEACTYRTFGAKVYYLPYFFGTPTPTDAKELYRLLYLASQEDEDRITPVERAYESRADLSVDANRLRFYVSAVMPHQTSRYDVFGETLNGRIQYPSAVANAHADVLSTSAFRDAEDASAALPTANWTLLSGDTTEDFIGPVASGWYFAETFPRGDDDTDASADDPRIEALVNVLSGTPIPVSLLLDAYVARIEEDASDNSVEGFPVLRVASQFAQLCALADADSRFLDGDGHQEAIRKPPSYESRTMDAPEPEAIADGGFTGEQNLQSFIDDTPALHQHDQRCGVFLLGALVGAVGDYQEWHEDLSTTLVDQFPVKSITTNRVKKVTQDAIEKTLTYTRQEKKREGKEYSGTKFDYIVDRLRKRVLDPDPDEWNLDKSDLRFYYALGITYGMNDYNPSGSDESTETEATKEE